MSTSLTHVRGVGPRTAARLKKAGFESAEDLAISKIGDLAAVPGFGEIRARETIKSARAVVAAVTKAASRSRRK